MSFLRTFLLVFGLGLMLVAGLWLVHERADAPRRPVAHARAVPAAPTRAGLLDRQAALVARAADALRPQRPKHVDLYSLGFAGDGTEQVFHNEVEYFARLMATRFDAEGHALSLDNSTVADPGVPLATLDNLREALKRIGARMDPEEDVLVLFLTSHGSREHELVVDRPPLKLEQVRPDELRRALDAAGIRWRVLIVSSCYSGGFVPELRDPRTLVITAARKDRSSFGCGSESHITYFGDAFLAHALNETTDFQAAFRRARSLVRQWEAAERDTPSEPQISVGSQIDARLAAWRAGAKPGPPLPFPRR